MKFNRFIYIIVLFILSTTINSYELENNLKAIITTKVAKFINLEKRNSKKFIITIFQNNLNDAFEFLGDYKIHSKQIEVKYIDRINQLEQTDILYISKASTKELETIFSFINTKKILTISDIRGFAQKGGMVQLYTKNQKLKLRINLDAIEKKNLKVKSSLLRISDVIRGDK